MARDHARIHLDIWGDDDWLDLTVDAQQLYWTLYTSPALTLCGAGEWNPGKIAKRAADWTPGRVESAGERLSRDLFLLVDEDTQEFLLRSWIKHDGLWRTPNMAVSVANARADLASRNLRGVVVFEVAKLRASEPSSSSWERSAVAKMLSQKAIDPAELEPFNPGSNRGSNGAANPWVKGGANPGSNGGRTTEANGGSNGGPTPAPTHYSNSNSGYVSTEGNEGATLEPPPGNCFNHPGGTLTKCGPCGDARKARELYDRTQTQSLAKMRSAQTRQAAEDRARLIADCPMCDDDGQVGTTLCTHDPGEVERNREGSAKVRAALAERRSADA